MAGRAGYVIAALLIVGGVALASYSYLFSQARFLIQDIHNSLDGGIVYGVHDLQAGDTMYGYLTISGERVDASVLDKRTFTFLTENNELPPDADPEMFMPGIGGFNEFSFTASKTDSYYLVLESTCSFFCEGTSFHIVLQQSYADLAGVPIVGLYVISGTLIASGVGLLVLGRLASWARGHWRPILVLTLFILAWWGVILLSPYSPTLGIVIGIIALILSLYLIKLFVEAI